MTGYRKKFKPYIGQIISARQLIRHRNIMLGLPIPRLSVALIPYGFEIDPDREGWLRPVQKELEALYYARVLQRRSSLPACAEWITNETGRPISWESLRIIFRTRPPLAAYLLPLHDRLSIATAETEEQAIKLDLGGPEFRRHKTSETKERYLKNRSEAVARAEEARRIKRLERFSKLANSDTTTGSKTT